MDDEKAIVATDMPTELSTASEELKKSSKEVLSQIIAETDITKVDELTELFNFNQKKKTMARIDKLSDLLDTITDQTIERFSKRPDEITTQETLQALKTVQDTLEKGRQQLIDQSQAPLIQINQQTNDINLGEQSGLSKDSRDKVKNAVANILAGIAQAQKSGQDEVIEVSAEESENNG